MDHTSATDEIIRSGYSSKVKVADIARRVGLSRNAVIGRARRLGISRPRKAVEVEVMVIDRAFVAAELAALESAAIAYTNTKNRVEAMRRYLVCIGREDMLAPPPSVPGE